MIGRRRLARTTANAVTGQDLGSHEARRAGADATHMLFVLTGFEAFDALFTDRGLPVEAVTALTIAMAERSVLRTNGGP